jgi:hypothetical protein
MQLVAAKHSKQKYNIHIHEEKYNKIKEFICWSESPMKERTNLELKDNINGQTRNNTFEN